MPTELNKTLSANIRRLRKERGWTMEQLAEYAGISWGAAHTVESAKHWPKPSTIEAIAKAFGVKSISLFVDQPNVPPKEWSDAELLEALAERFGFEPPGFKKATPPKKKKVD